MRSVESTAAWLKDLRIRLDQDIRLLHSLEPFWHPCLKCPDGSCCWHGSYFASSVVCNPFIAVEWWIALEYVRDTFTVEDRKQLAHNILSNRTACVFLSGNRCKIYPGRPWTSRILPYTISFYLGKNILPPGEIALPSCPKYAPAFDIKVNELRVQQPQILSHSENKRLVQLKLRKHKPLWFLDASNYVGECESYLANREIKSTTSPWNDLLTLAEEAGKEQGDVLKLYLKKAMGLD